MQNTGVSVHGTGKHDATTVKSASGSYVGNSTSNRAIPHTLSGTPKAVIISEPNEGIIVVMNGVERAFDSVIIAVTAADATNFSVGGPATSYIGNYTGRTYTWQAFL